MAWNDLCVSPQGLKLDEHTSSLSPVLEELRTSHLPLLSTEHPAGSMEYRDYVNLINSLCVAACTSLAKPLISVSNILATVFGPEWCRIAAEAQCT